MHTKNGKHTTEVNPKVRFLYSVFISVRHQTMGGAAIDAHTAQALAMIAQEMIDGWPDPHTPRNALNHMRRICYQHRDVLVRANLWYGTSRMMDDSLRMLSTYDCAHKTIVPEVFSERIATYWHAQLQEYTQAQLVRFFHGMTGRTDIASHGTLFADLAVWITDIFHRYPKVEERLRALRQCFDAVYVELTTALPPLLLEDAHRQLFNTWLATLSEEDVGNPSGITKMLEQDLASFFEKACGIQRMNFVRVVAPLNASFCVTSSQHDLVHQLAHQVIRAMYADHDIPLAHLTGVSLEEACAHHASQRAQQRGQRGHALHEIFGPLREKLVEAGIVPPGTLGEQRLRNWMLGMSSAWFHSSEDGSSKEEQAYTRKERVRAFRTAVRDKYTALQYDHYREHYMVQYDRYRECFGKQSPHANVVHNGGEPLSVYHNKAVMGVVSEHEQDDDWQLLRFSDSPTTRSRVASLAHSERSERSSVSFLPNWAEVQSPHNPPVRSLASVGLGAGPRAQEVNASRHSGHAGSVLYLVTDSEEASGSEVEDASVITKSLLETAFRKRFHYYHDNLWVSEVVANVYEALEASQDQVREGCIKNLLLLSRKQCITSGTLHGTWFRSAMADFDDWMLHLEIPGAPVQSKEFRQSYAWVRSEYHRAEWAGPTIRGVPLLRGLVYAADKESSLKAFFAERVVQHEQEMTSVTLRS